MSSCCVYLVEPLLVQAGSPSNLFLVPGQAFQDSLLLSAFQKKLIADCFTKRSTFPMSKWAEIIPKSSLLQVWKGCSRSCPTGKFLGKHTKAGYSFVLWLVCLRVVIAGKWIYRSYLKHRLGSRWIFLTGDGVGSRRKKYTEEWEQYCQWGYRDWAIYNGLITSSYPFCKTRFSWLIPHK